MRYQATFGIDGRVSPGFGVKYPDYIIKTEEVSADSTQVAYQNSMDMARKFADNHLSNPETGLTTVQLLSLRGPDEDVSFDALKSVVTQSMENHLLTFALKSRSNE